MISAPRWPQLQYNYDKPVDNVIEEQPPQPQPAPVQPPRSHQYRPHYVEQPTPQYQHPPQPQYEQPQYEQPQYEQPQKHIDPYRPQHFEYKEPEQPADIPVVQGTVRHQGVSTYCNKAEHAVESYHSRVNCLLNPLNTVNPQKRPAGLIFSLRV